MFKKYKIDFYRINKNGNINVKYIFKKSFSDQSYAVFWAEHIKAQLKYKDLVDYNFRIVKILDKSKEKEYVCN